VSEPDGRAGWLALGVARGKPPDQASIVGTAVVAARNYRDACHHRGLPCNVVAAEQGSHVILIVLLAWLFAIAIAIEPAVAWLVRHGVRRGVATGLTLLGLLILILGIVGSLVGLVFSGFTIGVSYWLPIALWVGVTSQFIPTVGTYIGGALPVIVALFYSPTQSLWVLIFIIVYQQVENYFFSPKISSRTMDIHPALAFGSVLVGAALLGPIGALIAIPVAAGVLAVLETYWQRQDLVPQLAEE
jgi:predicted PurR-regulated permease PerM